MERAENRGRKPNSSSYENAAVEAEDVTHGDPCTSGGDDTEVLEAAFGSAASETAVEDGLDMNEWGDDVGRPAVSG